MNNNNIYKSIFDAFAYLVLYIVIPVVQVILYIVQKQEQFVVGTFLLFVGMVYDSYTRFNPTMNQTQKRKILIIGSVSGLMIIITIVVMLLMASELRIGVDNWAYYLYFPIVAPIVICVWDLVGHILILQSIEKDVI